jgi:hypothetical protein
MGLRHTKKRRCWINFITPLKLRHVCGICDETQAFIGLYLQPATYRPALELRERRIQLHCSAADNSWTTVFPYLLEVGPPGEGSQGTGACDPGDSMHKWDKDKLEKKTNNEDANILSLVFDIALTRLSARENFL